jgi:hypothetical protein
MALVSNWLQQYHRVFLKKWVIRSRMKAIKRKGLNPIKKPPATTGGLR